MGKGDRSHFKFLTTVLKEVLCSAHQSDNIPTIQSLSGYPELVVLEFETTTESPGGYVKTQIAGPHPKVSESASVGWHLRNYPWQVMLMLLAGPHFEDHCPRWLFPDFLSLKPPTHISHLYSQSLTLPTHTHTQNQESFRSSWHQISFVTWCGAHVPFLPSCYDGWTI